MRTALRNRQNKIKQVINIFFFISDFILNAERLKGVVDETACVEALIGAMTPTYATAGCFQSRWMGEAQVVTVGMRRRLKTGCF